METLQTYTIRNIKESIPRMVLEKAFLSPIPMSFGMSNTLDTAIELAVLRDSVCKDVQVIASLEETIDLTGLPLTRQPNGGMVVHIPADRSGGRPILSVMKFCFQSGANAGDYGFSLNNNTIDRKLNRIVDGVEDRPISETTRCRMINPNTMVVDMDINVVTGVCAVVNIEVSENMSHIPREAWDRFSRMALEKAKQLTYNNLIAAFSEGAISRGMESNVLTNIINEYSSSAENYKDLYSQWRRAEIFLDDKRLRREISMRLPK